MFYFEKILVQMTSPLGLCFLFIPFGALLIALRRKRMGWCFVVLALGWLLLWSLPAPSVWLRASLERQFEQRAAADYPTADAIVVLGGGVQGGRKGWRTGQHLLDGADRAWFAAQLYHAGRAPVLILSGGNSSWSTTDEPEAEAMQAFEKDLGVPAEAVLLEDQSRNTRENVQYTKQLMAEHHLVKILLVTSAVHMPRALAAFQAQGIDAIPAPTDFEALPPRGILQRWLPDAEALDRSSKALKEYLAIATRGLQEVLH